MSRRIKRKHVRSEHKNLAPNLGGIRRRAFSSDTSSQELKPISDDWRPHVSSGKGYDLTRNVTPLKQSLFIPVQAKLTVGAVGDKYEQEADAVASKVVDQLHSGKTENSPDAVQRQDAEEEELQMKPLLEGLVQREEMSEEDEDVQMKPSLQRVGQGGGAISDDLESQIQNARGSGQGLAPELQSKMGSAMGADFSGVRIHTDAQSDELNQSIQAKAFTTGKDIFFRQGEYDPGSRGGQELIAHELTHVVQQNSSGTTQIHRRFDAGVGAGWHIHFDHIKLGKNKNSRVEFNGRGKKAIRQELGEKIRRYGLDTNQPGFRECINYINAYC